MKLHSNIIVNENDGSVMYEGIDISWDLAISDTKLDHPLTKLEIEAGTYFAKLARNRAAINEESSRTENIPLSEKRGKKYMACSAKYYELDSNRFEKGETKYPFYYWLNYGDGTTYGAFTVEEIQRWLSEDHLLLMDIKEANDEYPEKTCKLREEYAVRDVKWPTNNKLVVPEYFKTLDELISYSYERLKIRLKSGNMRIHRVKKGVLKNNLLKHSPSSDFKGEKCGDTYSKCIKELSFRIAINKIELPISTKIL